MKRIKYLLLFIISLFIASNSVLAASGSLQVSHTTVSVGEKFKVTVNVKEAAAWNVHVSSSGPASGCTINEADATSDATDTNKTFSVNCTATGEGIVTINLSGDVTSASDGNAVSLGGSKTISVIAASTNSNNNNNGNSNNTSNTSKSTNNKLKELGVEGYELVKIDKNHYTLEVSNDVSSVYIKAIAEDVKTKIEGAGNHELNVGDNTIEVIVTSESGAKNKVIIKITRKDGNHIEDIDILLSDNTSNEDIIIVIDKDTIIPKEELDKIKQSGKTVYFNYYNENNELEYSWIVIGNELVNTEDINTNILYEKVNSEEIDKASNYADSIYVNIKNNLKGVKVRIYVGDKYNDGDLVNVYGYKNKKLYYIKKDVKVVNGYIEFESDGYSEYVVTKSYIDDQDNILKTSIPVLLGTIVLLVIIIIILLFKRKKDNINN